ncbi:uncharacterized protein CANTADRAFT_48854 [Suhomyces tanzawaensis NRRL Y-17324]|uniref:C2H2-type domain-containing protein n=1 Tax=Suhomyces tanzawaensis NRRL Y-17324 TaxID=984487 RepID=A0A1E4SLC2_9ASCO|nr:uncharacterized protein CANTADRAFT_48854 [Suhomyces tanzawaensis NRRL Y-17324]ODV80303.1 hypothetical protein CANTADRAFT_48854 [Suhomyces tanzawaensis NRRL Y-17324]
MSSFIPHQANPQTSAFTCNTCNIRFLTAELQRQHMKTEWHRYNLKRRVAQLPSISSDVFADKVLSQEQFGESRENEDEDGFYVHHRKTKNNTNKLLSKMLAHKKVSESRGRKLDAEDFEEIERAASPASIASEFSQFSLGDSTSHEFESGHETGSELNFSESDYVEVEAEAEDTESSDSEVSEDESIEELQAVPITNCFYCGKNNEEVELNIKHMYKNHGLYIPERSYLTDVIGLLLYMSEVISVDLECLVCGFEGRNLTSVRQHMYSKGHCKLPYETKDEKLAVSEFYNFYELEDTPVAKTSNKKVSFMGATDAEQEQTVGEQEEEGEEEDSFDDHGINDNYTLVTVDRSGVELTLPTGSRIGHRSMARYYRQNLALAPQPSESNRTVALVDRRFAPGLTVHEVTKQDKQARRLEQKLKNYDVNRSKSYRANYQKHYVDQMLGHA